MVARDREVDDLGLLHRHDNLGYQPVQIVDLLLRRLFALRSHVLLGLLRRLYADRISPLLPKNAFLAVLEVEEFGAASVEAGRSCTVTTLGQDQLESTLVLGGAERAGDERNRSWPLRALECP